jgi:hypothetical protein
MGAVVCLILLAVCIGGLCNVSNQHKARHKELVDSVYKLILIEKEYAYAEGQFDALTTNRICIEIVSSNDWKYVQSPWDDKNMAICFSNKSEYLKVITGKDLSALGLKQ